MAARNYVSTALPTVLAADLGASGNPSVISLPGTWPASFPYPVLLDWGTSSQEAILVTSAPTGTGPYTLPCTRGIDNTTQQAHSAGAQVEHGTTGYEPTLIQENAAAIAALEAGVGGGAVALAGDLGNTTADPQVLSTHLSAPLPENQGGTGSASQNWQGLLSPVTQTGTYTATAGQLVKANISSASWTLTLPTAPAANTIIGAKIMANASGNTHALTVACGSGDFFEQSGGGTSVTMSLPLQAAAWQYNSGYWTRVSDDLPLGQLNGLYSEKPATTEVTYYVSAASGASDSSDGLSWGSPKATIAGALTALGSSAGLIQLGAGTFTIAAADGSGNGATLTHAGTCVRGLGMYRTTVSLGASVTYGLVAKAALCEFAEMTIQAASGVTVTYAAGVTTSTTAESCRFANVEIQGFAGGTITNGFGVSPDAHEDVAYTTFYGCVVTGVTNAGWIIGDGTQANVLDTRMFGCVSQGNAYGVYSAATGFQWIAGDMGENTTCDIWVSNPAGSPVTVQGMRSENSAALLTTGTAATLAAVISLRDVTWSTSNTYIVSSGIIINHQVSGTLNLDNVQMTNYTTSSPVAPCLILGGTSPLVTATGLSTNAAINELFSATPGGNVGLVVTNYMQVTASLTESATTPGPTNFVSSGEFSFNGTGRDVMVPYAVLTSGVIASRPAAALANINEWYLSTDTDVLYFSSGSSWVDVVSTSGGSSAQTGPRPASGGYVAWSSDPTANGAPAVPTATNYTAGHLYLWRADTVPSVTVNGYITYLWRNIAGMANSYFAVYTLSGTTLTLVDYTADLSSAATGLQRTIINQLGVFGTGSYVTPAGGVLYVGYLNGTSGVAGGPYLTPSLWNSDTPSSGTLPPSYGNYRVIQGGSGYTAPPGTFSLSSPTVSGATAFWALD